MRRSFSPYTDVSNSESSASLEVHSTAPLFDNLAHSIPSDEEDYIGDLNTTLAHMAGENSNQRGSLEEQVKAQGEVIRVLSTKFDNLIELITALTWNRSPDGAPQALEDPQDHEVEGIASARPPRYKMSLLQQVQDHNHQR